MGEARDRQNHGFLRHSKGILLYSKFHSIMFYYYILFISFPDFGILNLQVAHTITNGLSFQAFVSVSLGCEVGSI